MEQNPNPTPASQAPTPTQPVAPQPLTTWPGAFGVYKTSRAAVRLNLATLIYLYLISFGSSFVIGLLFHRFQLIGQLVSFLIGIAISVALATALLASIRGRKMDVGASFENVGSLWLNMLGATILTVLAAVGSSLLLIVPAFFVVPRLVLTPYFVIDQKLGPLAAYKASWHATKGNVGKVWGIIGASLAMVLLFVTIIGIPFAIYFLFMYYAATPLLYDYLRRQTTAPEVQPADPAAVQQPAAS